jgi:outer membrane receptor for ferrienterochelin and colicins
MKLGFLVLALCVSASQALAQTGTITGIVHDDEGRPLQFARVFVVGTALSAESGVDGGVRIRNVPAGARQLRTSLGGYHSATVADVVVERDTTVRFTVRLTRIPVQLEGIVVSVSRRPEELTRAPAAVTAFSGATVGAALGGWMTETLKRTPSITLAQVGVISSTLNGRGFNKSYSARWLTIEDGHPALLPETGVAVGDHSTISKVDIAAAEVIAGGGSALYGANAANGVLSVRTKDPRDFPGTTVEVSAGTRNYIGTQIRHAGTIGSWGFKATAELQSAREWEDTVYYAAPRGGPPLRATAYDPDTRVWRGSGSIRYYFPHGARIALNAGASRRDGVAQSGQGRIVLDGYEYQQMQLEFSSARWFAQAFASHSNAGGAYQLQVLTPTLAANPALSTDSARSIAGFPLDGRLLVAEVRYADVVGSRIQSGVHAIDNARVTIGGQLRRDRAFSNGRMYTDVYTGEPVIVDQKSWYAQLQSPLTPTLQLNAAARYDQSDRLRGRWSPNLALLYDVAPRQTLRLTYNEGFVPATMTQTDFYGLNPAAGILVRGNSNGFIIKDSLGNVVRTIEAVGPETNRTWEFGYRGILGDRLFADLTVYRSQFKGFIGPAVIIANPLGAPRTYAYDASSGEPFTDDHGAPLQVRSVYNMGSGTLAGLDVGMRYRAADHFSINYAINFSDITQSAAVPGDPPEVTAFNTSPTRMNLSIERHDLAGANATLSSRYVHSYPFDSGANRGMVPSFATIGAALRWSLGASTTLLLQSDNILTCVGGTSVAPVLGITNASRATYIRDRSCAFGKRHMETPNMPSIGTSFIIGLRREWQ